MTEAPYPFADIELARRLERTEARGNVEFVEARARAMPDRGATWIEVAGTYAMFDGVGSPLTQTFCLGISADHGGPPRNDGGAAGQWLATQRRTSRIQDRVHENQMEPRMTRIKSGFHLRHPRLKSLGI